METKGYNSSGASKGSTFNSNNNSNVAPHTSSSISDGKGSSNGSSRHTKLIYEDLGNKHKLVNKNKVPNVRYNYLKAKHLP